MRRSRRNAMVAGGLAIVAVLAIGTYIIRSRADQAPELGGSGTAEQWETNTRNLLDRTRWLDAQTPASVLVSTEDAGSYTIAMAAVALGPDVPQFLTVDEQRAVVSQLLSRVAAKGLHVGQGGHGVWLLEMLLDAAEYLPDMAGEMLAEVGNEELDSILAGGGPGRYKDRWPESILDVGTVVAMGDRAGHRPDELRAWAAKVGRSMAPNCSTATIFELRYALVAGVEPQCARSQLASRVSAELTKLTQKADKDLVYEGDHIAMLASMVAILALEPGLRDGLVAAIAGASRAVATLPPGEAIFELRNLRRAARFVDVDVDVQPLHQEFLHELLLTGGIPNIVLFADADPVEFIKAALAVHASKLVYADTTAAGSDRVTAFGAVQDVVWAPAASAGNDAGSGAIVAQLLSLALNDATFVDPLVQTLLVSGGQACSVVGASAAGLLNAALGLGPAVAARAVRAFSACANTDSERSKGLVAAAQDALSRLDSAKSPSLPEAAEAVAVLCALEPTALPEPALRWRAYQDRAHPLGGVRKPGSHAISMAGAYDLATVILSTVEACSVYGLPGVPVAEFE